MSSSRSVPTLALCNEAEFGLWKMKTLGQLMAYNLLDVCETNAACDILAEERVRAAAAKAEGKPVPRVTSSSSGSALSDDEADVKVTALEELKTASKRAYGALLGALNSDQLRMVQHVQTGDAHGVWSTLLAHYERKSVATRVGLIESLFNMKMESGESVNLYAARVTEMNRKLLEQEERISDTVLLFVLLRGLARRYDTIVALLKMKEKLVWIEVIEALKNEEERQKNTGEREEQANFAHKTGRGGAGSGGGGGGGGSGMTCYTCGQPGHIKYHCPRNSSKKKCSRCHRVGHTVQECRAVTDAAASEETASLALATEYAKRAAGAATWNNVLISDEDW